MCNQLLQLFACGHDKSVCITPCPHAIATGEQPDPDHGPELLRSSSVASSIAAPSRTRSDTQGSWGGASARAGIAAGGATPLRVSTPAFRLLVPGCMEDAQGGGSGGETGIPKQDARTTITPAVAVALTCRSPSPAPNRLPTPPTATLTRPVSTIPTASPVPSFSALIPRLTRPPSSSSSSSSPSPSPSHPPQSFKADPEAQLPPLNHCPHPTPRYLPQSLRPCLSCFVTGAAWAGERERMKAQYRKEHHGVREGDVERECGLERLRGEFGGF